MLIDGQPTFGNPLPSYRLKEIDAHLDMVCAGFAGLSPEELEDLRLWLRRDLCDLWQEVGRLRQLLYAGGGWPYAEPEMHERPDRPTGLEP